MSVGTTPLVFETALLALPEELRGCWWAYYGAVCLTSSVRLDDHKSASEAIAAELTAGREFLSSFTEWLVR